MTDQHNPDQHNPDQHQRKRKNEPPSTAPTAQARARLDSTSAGFTGDACQQCGNFTLIRTGVCLTCVTCGYNTGCS